MNAEGDFWMRKREKYDVLTSASISWQSGLPSLWGKCPFADPSGTGEDCTLTAGSPSSALSW